MRWLPGVDYVVPETVVKHFRMPSDSNKLSVYVKILAYHATTVAARSSVNEQQCCALDAASAGPLSGLSIHVEELPTLTARSCILCVTKGRMRELTVADIIRVKGYEVGPQGIGLQLMSESVRKQVAADTCPLCTGVVMLAACCKMFC